MSLRINEKSSSIIAALIGVVASIISATILFTTDKVTSIKFGDLSIEAQKTKSIELSNKVLENLKEEQVQLKNQINAITKLQKTVKIPQNAIINQDINELKTKIVNLEKQLNVINNVIMQSPEKALTIPIIQNDIKTIKLQYEHAIKSLEREINSAYDIIKWVLGTIVLGILGIATSVFMAANSKK